MLITFTLPVFAQDFEPVQDVIDLSGGYQNSETGSEATKPDIPDNSEDTKDNENTESNSEVETGETKTSGNPALGYSGETATDNGNFFLDCTPEQAARLIAFYEYVAAQIARQSGPQRAAPGDTGSVSWTWGESVGIDVPSGDPGNPYHIGNIPLITLNTAKPPLGRPFCVEFGTDPQGSYSASKGNDSRVLGLLVAFQKGQASAVGVQLALWYTENGLPLSSQTQAAAALSAAASVDTTGYTYLIWNSGSGQPFVTLDKEDSTVPPPVVPPDGEDNPNTHTEVTTETTTHTEVRSSTTYEYSDAIGQITICKRDDEGKSLDGAIFNIQIEFANGERGGDSAFEVHNGSRLFTYTHPRDDHDPAKITVTEVRSPTGYTGSTTPQTAIVHPTYTRVTKVLTHTITITTTTTTTSVIDIDSGEILAESSATATAETELNPPTVQEYTDFIEGDRETTLTFINYPNPCSLTIYKYEKGNYGKALAGARFRIRYADINVSAQVWELTTDSSGKIIINPLPKAGTLVVEELQAPGGYEIGAQSTFTITIAKGEHKQLDVSNDKRAQLIVYKKDAVSGQLLQGAVFRATLIGQGIVKTAESGSDGRALFTDLIPGEWRIEEQTPPPYFLPTTKVETVFIPDGSYQTLELTFENEPYSGLTIRKVSYHDGRGLKGAVFGLYRGSEAHPLDFLGEFQSDDNGRILIENLESNQYYTVVERQPPAGFLLDEDNTRTILIKPDALDNNITLIFRNKEKPKILIEKVDDIGNPVPNCTFKVSRRDSAEYVMVTTDAKGQVLVEDLYEDWYQVFETRVADGYVLSTEVKDVQLEAGKTTKLQFVNYRKPTITIRKIDEATGLGLDNAVIRVWREGVDEYQDYTTSDGGYIRLTNESPGFVLLQEQRAPIGFLLSDEIHRIELMPGQHHEFTMKNKSLPKLTLRKIDEQTLEGIEGVTFRLTKDGEFRDVTTGKNGVITAQLSPGWWTYVETSVPDEWILNPTPGYVELVAGQDKEIVVKNQHKPSLKIIKLDALTRQPMEGVRFEISIKNGAPLGTYKTDENGEILLVNIEPNTLIIKELPFDGYLALDLEKEVIVEWGKLVVVEFQNQPKNPIIIKKINSVTGEPISGALFSVSKVNGTFIGEYRTGRNGFITVTGIEPGFFQIREVKPAPGFILDETVKTVELKYNSVAEVEFENKPLNGIEIYKIDSKTKEPLEGVEFTVKKKSGDLVGVYRTSVSGRIEIADLQPGWYSVYESATSSPEYLLDATVRDVELKWNDYVLLEFSNTKYSGLQVRKVDSVTKLPLQGIKFRITKLTGDIVGDFVTGPGGFFTVDGLEPNTYYTCFETASIPGYILDQTPQTFQIKKGESIVLEFENKPLSGLQIRKTDAVTGLPLAGVEFKVTELDSRLIGNYTTPESGIIFIEGLKPGYYIVQEIKGLSTHKPDTAPRNVLVETGKLNVVEYRNQPYPVLEVQKIDSETKQPLSGVRFRLLDKYQREIGVYTTSNLGKIILSGMDEGKYFLQEVEAKSGYQLDSTAKEINLLYGKTTVVEIKNTPMATLRIKKIDAITKKPIAGVVFLLRDMKNNIIGEYTTDNTGLIELPKTIEAGKYKLQEIRTDDLHVLDEQVRTIEVKAGETTEIVVENKPKQGRIQIIKTASENSPINKVKKGSGLAGAVFEVFDERFNLVDVIETDKRGIGTSDSLPLGKYVLKETKSPEFFYSDGKPIYVELKVHDDLVRFTVENRPEDIEVSVEKRGIAETMSGETFRYDFSSISNLSNCSLDEFYWHDKLPQEVRIESINTGTWSERLNYDVWVRTNLKGWKKIKSNLHTNVEYTIDVRNHSLGLASNEYVTEFKLEFGTVQEGFHCNDNPFIMVRVIEGLPQGHRFVNLTDVGGKRGKEWAYDRDSWVTVIYRPHSKLPKTGDVH